MKLDQRKITAIAVIGGLTVMAILVLGTVTMGQSARNDTDVAVRAVSLLYLDELAERKAQVVSENLASKEKDMRAALELMTEEDLSSARALQAYQERTKKLFNIEKFAFVDEDGLIYTSKGTRDDIDSYAFDHRTIAEPEVSVKGLDGADRKVVIAVPTRGRTLEGKELVVCFMEIGMEEMLGGLSMKSQENDATFCNIYTAGGVALSDAVLGGLAVEDNLLEAMKKADLDEGYSYEKFTEDFRDGRRGEVCFTYNGIKESLSYVRVNGTEWMLTYLIRESVISDQISSITDSTVTRGMLQTILTVIVMLAVFAFIVALNRRGARLQLEKDTAEAVSKAKTSFLSNMSHEIRTPMNAIIGLDKIALSDPDTPPKTREYLEKIGSSADHLLDLINDILDMSRIESGRMVLRSEDFSLEELLDAVNVMFSGQCGDKGLEYSCQIDGDVGGCYIGDSMKLRQILINILGNAVKFTPEGGKVELQVRRIPQQDGRSDIRFRISDTGVGMDREFLPHIFDSFTQEDPASENRYGSTGLGMAITKSLVEIMGGSIEVESEKGKGTTFTVTVTLEEAGGKEQKEQKEAAPEPGRGGDLSGGDLLEGRRVLLAEDVAINAEIVTMLLEAKGVTVDLAENGKAAAERFAEGEEGFYDAVLMDMRMPVMDGLEAARAIRAMDRSDAKTIPIIALTANTFDTDVQRSIEAGMDAHLAKPVDPDLLFETLERMLGGAGRVS